MNPGLRFIKAITLYLLATITYFFLGRYHWYVPDPARLALFVLGCIFALYIGYTRTIRMPMPSDNRGLKFDRRIAMLFRLSCFSLIVFQVVWVLVFLGEFRILHALELSGVNYFARLNFIYEGGTSLIMQIRTLLWGITLFAYPIGFVCYKKLTIPDRALLIVTVLVDIFAAVNMGVNKNIGDILLIYLACALVKGVHWNGQRKVDYFSRRGVSLLVAIVLFFVMFSFLSDIRDYETFRGRVAPVNVFARFADMRDFTVFDVVAMGSNTFMHNFDRLGTYVSHGYAGLAFALELPFYNTYGIGFSRALMEYAEQLFGLALQSRTYNSRIEAIYGWPDGMYWPTAFVWLGNAFSLPFVPVIMVGFGVFMARTVQRYMARADVFSLALLCQLFIGAIYLPANAQLVQSRSSLWGTILLVALFLLSTRKVRCNVF